MRGRALGGYARVKAWMAGIAMVSLLGACQEPVEHTAGEADPEAADIEGLDSTSDPAAPQPSLLDDRAEPATTGLDSVLLAQAQEELGSLSRFHNLIVARHGEVLLQRNFRGPPSDRPVNVKSVSKSLLSGVVGRAIQEGHLEGVDQPIGPFFAEYLTAADGEADEVATPEGRDPRKEITVGNLLAMSSGLESTSFGSRYGRWVASSDWVGYALEEPMTFEPGSRMVYSTGNTHLLSAILTRSTDRSTHAFARAALAEPLGITLPRWPRDPNGIYFGGNDMLISPRDLVRFGELYRNGGVLDGERILPREWIEASWDVRVRSPRNGDGYGLGWWARESSGHAVRFGWGYGGQFLFVVPSLELTVVFTSDPYGSRERGHNRTLHQVLDEYIVPAAEAGASSETRGDTQDPR